MKKDLTKLTKADLVTAAKGQGIKNAQQMKKAELIALIEKRQTRSAAPATPAKPAKKRALKIFSRKRPTVTKDAPEKKKTPAKKAPEAKKPAVVPPVSETKKIKMKEVISPRAPEMKPQESMPETTPIRYATGELPATYHETKLVAIVRDPYWAFSYWDLSDETQHYIDSLYREYDGIRPILRIHDVTGVSFNGSNGNRNWDIDVSLDARNWYLNLGSPGASFVIDLGLKDKTGRFFLIARSNTISLPTDYPSNIVDEKWMISDIDFDELYALSGGFGVGLSSGELPRGRKGELFQELLSSGAVSSQAAISPEKKQKEFFLEVATELILYGRTHADATLTVDDKKIKLRPDGTFSLRYFLPDGSLRLPVKAVSADNDDMREVKIKVEKETR